MKKSKVDCWIKKGLGDSVECFKCIHEPDSGSVLVLQVQANDHPAYPVRVMIPSMGISHMGMTVFDALQGALNAAVLRVRSEMED